MNTIYYKVAPRDLFGVEIISRDLKSWDQTPIQGTVMPLGIIDNIRIFEFVKNVKANTWLTVDDVVFSGGIQLAKLGVKTQGFYAVNMLSDNAEVGNYCDRGKTLTRTRVINGVYQNHPDLKAVG